MFLLLVSFSLCDRVQPKKVAVAGEKLFANVNREKQLENGPVRRSKSVPGPNVIRNPDGSYECIPQYTSGDVIDSRGCWKCNERCGSGQVCQYPGECVFPTPTITKVTRYQSSYVVKYKVENFANYEPVEAFCRTNGDPFSAESVTKDTVVCKVFSEDKSTLTNHIEISFDSEAWTTDFSKGGFMSSFSGAKIAFVIGAVAIVVVASIVLFKIIKRKKTPPHVPIAQRMLERESHGSPLAFFPQVKETKYSELAVGYGPK